MIRKPGECDTTQAKISRKKGWPTALEFVERSFKKMKWNVPIGFCNMGAIDDLSKQLGWMAASEARGASLEETWLECIAIIPRSNTGIEFMRILSERETQVAEGTHKSGIKDAKGSQGKTWRSNKYQFRVTGSLVIIQSHFNSRDD